MGRNDRTQTCFMETGFSVFKVKVQGHLNLDAGRGTEFYTAKCRGISCFLTNFVLDKPHFLCVI